jgi:hypothetical protein
MFVSVSLSTKFCRFKSGLGASVVVECYLKFVEKTEVGFLVLAVNETKSQVLFLPLDVLAKGLKFFLGRYSITANDFKFLTQICL